MVTRKKRDNEHVNPSVTPKGTANQCVVTKGRERWNLDKTDKIEDNCRRPTPDCAPALILGDSMNVNETQAPSTHFTKPAGGVSHALSHPTAVPVPNPSRLPFGEQKKPKRALELFCGTGSVAKRLRELGYEVVTLDINPRFRPTISVDILRWGYRRIFSPGYFDLIVASPPCENYSQAKTTKDRDLAYADKCVRKTLEIVRYFQPPVWWMENPRFGLLRHRPFMNGVPYCDVDYCQFSDWGYKKPTRIWGNTYIGSLPPKLCDPSKCPHMVTNPGGRRVHREALGGNHIRFTPEKKSRFPTFLVDYLLGIRNTQPNPALNPLTCATESPQSVRPGAKVPGVRQEGDKTASKTTVVKPYCCQDRNFFRTGSIKFRGEELQLVMEVSSILPDGKECILKILIDTGAQANLVRKGLISDFFMRDAAEKLSLRTANGQCMEGGEREVELDLGFRQIARGELLPEPRRLKAIFYEADIRIDAILSFPWLVSNELGVFPHLKTLASTEPDFVMLCGIPRGWSKRAKNTQHEASRWEGADHRREGSKRRRRWIQINREPIQQLFVEEERRHLMLKKMRLHLETEVDTLYRDFLSDCELKVVEYQLAKTENSCEIHALTAVSEKENLPEGWDLGKLEELRRKIHEDFDGTALRDEVFPNPPVRGKYGYATIPLEENAEPVRQKTFHMYGERKEAMEKITQDWIAKEFIERPQKGGLEWLSRAFAVPKKSSTFPWRGVADMRGPNERTRRCSYPLPSIEDILVKQGAKQIFSILDLRQAFHQQPLHPDSRHITCTNTPYGIFQWKVNVMGLKNAAIQFQMMIDDRLEPVRDVADAYIDDIIVGTRVEPGEDLFAAHNRDLRRVLQLLKDEQLIADVGKCRFFVPEVEFCGHILRNGTRKPAPGKLSAIERWEVPKTISELRAFLGFTNYYSSYVEGYASVVACLQDKLKVSKEEGKMGSKKKILWTPTDQGAFNEIKRRLCSKLVLQRVDPDRPFVLRVDASGYAVGGVLEQLVDEARRPTPEDVLQKKTVPVAFMSRKLTQCQRNWVPREQETYAIILALQKWESWIGLQPVLVLTDHKALEHWSHEVLDPPSGPLGRRSRWHQILSKYDLTVGYIPGKENTVADILSRWAYPASQALRDISIHGSEKDDIEMRRFIDEEKGVERACTYMLLRDPPIDRNLWVRGLKKRLGEGGGGPPPPAPKRFFFKQPQGRGKPQETGQGTSQPVIPPRRRAGKGTGREIPEGEEEESSDLEIPEEDEEGALLSERRGGVGQPSSDSSQHAHPPEELPSGAPSSSTTAAPQLNVSQLETCDWEEQYRNCPHWSEFWEQIHSNTSEWPRCFQFVQGKLRLEDRLCLPLSLQNAHIRQYHDFMGHPGPERLWKRLVTVYEFADFGDAKQFTERVMSECEICQACQRPSHRKGPIVHTPIPSNVMTWRVSPSIFFTCPLSNLKVQISIAWFVV